MQRNAVCGRPAGESDQAISRNVHERIRAIETLKNASVHTCTVDVQPDDQVLMLVTCVGDDTLRRVVAARRGRDGEDERALQEAVNQSTAK